MYTQYSILDGQASISKLVDKAIADGMPRIIGDSKALHNRVLLQQIPCDDHLQTVINAMKKKERVAVKYRKFECDDFTTLDFEPYCLKLFNQRWYVLAHFHRDATPEKDERDYLGAYSFDASKFTFAQKFQ